MFDKIPRGPTDRFLNGLMYCPKLAEILKASWNIVQILIKRNSMIILKSLKTSILEMSSFHFLIHNFYIMIFVIFGDSKLLFINLYCVNNLKRSLESSKIENFRSWFLHFIVCAWIQFHVTDSICWTNAIDLLRVVM